LGEAEAARGALAHLAKLHPRTPEGAVAAVEAKRLAALAAAAPFLGVQFTGQTTVVHAVVPHGPADHAGLQRGDRIDRVGPTMTPSLAELRTAVKGARPGDKLPLQVFRDGRLEVLVLEVGAQPEKE
jgi:S1-C subfamily serine protease